MEKGFHPHEITWTRDKATRFWTFLSSCVPDNIYFSKQKGNQIFRYAKKYVPIARNVLDYGCGLGHMIEILLANGVECSGLDFSDHSISITNNKFGSHSLFRGATLAREYPLSIEDETYNSIFLIETIEHLLPDELDTTLNEISRILKVGGHLIITTPFAENLYQSNVICPDCGCIFHNMQHISSWTARSLVNELKRHSFKTITCKGVIFGPTPIMGYLENIKLSWNMVKPQTIIYIGEKQQAR